MEHDLPIDLDEVRRNVNRAQINAFYFPYFRRTLLIDTRSSEVDPPMAKLVPMVRSAEERVRELQRLRPRFGRPESVILVPWPRFVASAKRVGVWQVMIDRLEGAGEPQAELVLERCYRELLGEERAELRRAVRGEGYKTLWERRKRSEV